MRRRVLFLDDDPNRHEYFSSRMQGLSQVDHVWTASQAIRKLSTSIYDEVWLDHDLHTEHYSPGLVVGAVVDAGFAVAAFIAKMDDPPARVVVHSWNEEGTAAMVAILREAGVSVAAKEFPV